MVIASWRWLGDVSLRFIASAPVGYVVASLWAMALARVLPMTTAAATITATIVAFAICAIAIMWAYAARSGWRALWTLVAIGVVAGAITCVSITLSGRA